MNDNRVTMIGFLFFLFCAALAGGVFFLNNRYMALQEEYDALKQRRVDIEQTTSSLIEQKALYTSSFATLRNYRVNAASNDIAFYSEVQRAVQNDNIEILSTRQQGTNREGRNTITMALKGDYYSFVKVLAEWRKLPVTVRVAAVDLSASKTPETRGEIQANVTVEAIVSAGSR